MVSNHGLTSQCRPLAGLVSTLLIALVVAACPGKEAGPLSEKYEEAHTRFSKVYAQKLDQAFLDPEMEEIEALLAQVPPDSSDAPSAKELQQRITEGRARMEAARQETEDAIASARQVETFPTTPTPAADPEPEPEAPATVPVDAGTPDAGRTAGPVPGTPASELSAGFQGCFRRGQPVNVTGTGSRDTYEMERRASCELAYPSFAGQLLVIEDGRVLAVLPKSAVRVNYVGPDGGVVPDAGR
jgi:hypothetical protein